MPKLTYTEWETHFKDMTPENRQAIHKATMILLSDNLINKNIESLTWINIILSSIRIQRL
jgi:hypothetical protein